MGQDVGTDAPSLSAIPKSGMLSGYCCNAAPDHHLAAGGLKSSARMQMDAPPLHDVDIRLLKIFKCVVECAGFSASEEVLGVGRSTISKHISDLETRLGLRLCERGRSGFRISAHGRTVYKATVELLDSLERFRSQVSSAKVNLGGDLSLWLMDNTVVEADNPVSRALYLFRKRPGAVMLTLNAAAPDSVEQAVAARKAHVGLTISRSDLPGLTYMTVGYEHAALYCGQRHTLFDQGDDDIAADALEHHDFVTRGYLVGAASITGPRSNSTALALHVEATVQLILTGDYLGILPDHIAKPWVQRGQLRLLPLGRYRTKTPISIVLRERARDVPAIDALVTDLAASYAAQTE